MKPAGHRAHARGQRIRYPDPWESFIVRLHPVPTQTVAFWTHFARPCPCKRDSIALRTAAPPGHDMHVRQVPCSRIDRPPPGEHPAPVRAAARHALEVTQAFLLDEAADEQCHRSFRMRRDRAA